MKKYTNISTFYLILGLFMGISYREITKHNNFTGETVLSSVHTHTHTLGYLFFLIVLLLDYTFKLSAIKSFKQWIVAYNISLLYLVITLTLWGVCEVFGTDIAGLNHIAGLGHAFLGISLVWFVIILRKAVK